MKKLTFILTLLFAFLFSTNAIASNPLMDNSTQSNSRVTTNDSFELSQYTGVTIDYIGVDTKVVTQCTVSTDMKVQMAGQTKTITVSATAETCLAAYKEVKAGVEAISGT